jgi:hypothetical protein
MGPREAAGDGGGREEAAASPAAAATEQLPRHRRQQRRAGRGHGGEPRSGRCSSRGVRTREISAAAMAVAGAHVHRDSGQGDAGLRDGRKEGAERILELHSKQAGAAEAGRSRRRRGRVVRRGHGRELSCTVT